MPILTRARLSKEPQSKYQPMYTSQVEKQKTPKTRWKKTQQPQQVDPISMYLPMDNTQEFQQATFVRNLVDTSSFVNDMCNFSFPPNASPSYGRV